MLFDCEGETRENEPKKNGGRKGWNGTVGGETEGQNPEEGTFVELRSPAQR